MNADMRLDMPMLQLAALGADNAENRAGYRCFGHSYEVNDQSFQLTRDALSMLADGYSAGKVLLLNHNRDGIGMGKTTRGEVDDEGLYVTWYILRGQEFPQGPLATSEQVIAAVDDGAIESVSMGLKILTSECSICGAAFDFNMPFFRMCENGHEQGRDVIVEKGGTKEIQTVVQIITAAEATELSLVYDGADKGAKILSKVAALRRDGMIGDAAYTQFNSQFQSINLGGNPPPQPQGAEPMSELQAEVSLLKEKINTKDAEVRALTAELQLEKDKVMQLSQDSQRYSQFKQDSEFARELILTDLGEQYAAHREGITEADKTEKIESVKALPLKDLYEQAQGFRSIADERFRAGRSSKDDKGNPPADPRKGGGITTPAGSARY